VAVIAAGMFAALGQNAAAAGERKTNGEPSESQSNWKNAAKREGLH
jgi:hypothetical protein